MNDKCDVDFRLMSAEDLTSDEEVVVKTADYLYSTLVDQQDAGLPTPVTRQIIINMVVRCLVADRLVEGDISPLAQMLASLIERWNDDTTFRDHILQLVSDGLEEGEAVH